MWSNNTGSQLILRDPLDKVWEIHGRVKERYVYSQELKALVTACYAEQWNNRISWEGHVKLL